jgi:hypothetical protein
MEDLTWADTTNYEETTNEQRASWAAVALLAYGKNKEFIREELGDDEAPCLIVEELLADLAHWCDRNDVNLPKAIQRATLHYQNEVGSLGRQLA